MCVLARKPAKSACQARCFAKAGDRHRLSKRVAAGTFDPPSFVSDAEDVMSTYPEECNMHAFAPQMQL